MIDTNTMIHRVSVRCSVSNVFDNLLKSFKVSVWAIQVINAGYLQPVPAPRLNFSPVTSTTALLHDCGRKYENRADYQTVNSSSHSMIITNIVILSHFTCVLSVQVLLGHSNLIHCFSSHSHTAGPLEVGGEGGQCHYS